MSSLPDKDALLEWIRENPAAAGKREIARAFGIRGADRVELKRLLRELEDEGHVEKRRRRVRPAGTLPPVTVLEVLTSDGDGDLFAKPQKWEEDGAPPRALIRPKRGDPALGQGDRILAKVRPVSGEDHEYEARLIKKIAASERRMLGIFRAGHEGARLMPIDRRSDREWVIPAGDTDGAEDGELVEAEELRGRIMGLPRGRVVARHGDPGASRQVSLIAMVQHQIPYEFAQEVMEQARDEAPLTELGAREDLRDLPLLTIDPADARDHDDAVCAVPDDDPANPGGHIVWVAIADVAHHVRPGTLLDREARRRGNSTYFPDRVSPMLPDVLSGDLCSLHEGVDRPCMAVRMVLDAEGNKIAHRFSRGLMNSAASLTYEQAQAVANGAGAEREVPEDLHGSLRDLYAAYGAAARARDRRQPLDLDLPERRVELSDDGVVTAVRLRERLEAHRLIEEFMILANVCAAETLEAKRSALLFRVHEEPAQEKLDALRETVETVGLTLAKGQVLKTRHLNALLQAARESEASEMISMSVLRAQTQAYYAQENFGHFGLNLARYAHFTSPIRRYADLIVHRALIRALNLGPDGLTDNERENLSGTAEHISQTERRSMMAERDTVDRYLAAFLSDQHGAEFEGKIAGVAKFGIFVKLEETGADGLVPVSTLGRDYFRFDDKTNTLTGDESGLTLSLGLAVRVRLIEATPVTGGLIFELLHVEGAGSIKGRSRSRSSGPRRKLARAKIKKAKAARKAKRKH